MAAPKPHSRECLRRSIPRFAQQTLACHLHRGRSTSTRGQAQFAPHLTPVPLAASPSPSSSRSQSMLVLPTKMSTSLRTRAQTDLLYVRHAVLLAEFPHPRLVLAILEDRHRRVQMMLNLVVQIALRIVDRFRATEIVGGTNHPGSPQTRHGRQNASRSGKCHPPHGSAQ